MGGGRRDWRRRLRRGLLCLLLALGRDRRLGHRVAWEPKQPPTRKKCSPEQRRPDRAAEFRQPCGEDDGGTKSGRVDGLTPRRSVSSQERDGTIRPARRRGCCPRRLRHARCPAAAELRLPHHAAAPLVSGLPLDVQPSLRSWHGSTRNAQRLLPPPVSPISARRHEKTPGGTSRPQEGPSARSGSGRSAAGDTVEGVLRLKVLR